MAKFLINNGVSNIGLMEGKLLVPIGGYIEVSDSEAENDHVQEALRRGWVKLGLQRPDGENVAFKADLEFSVPAIHGSKEFPKDRAQKSKPVAATT